MSCVTFNDYCTKTFCDYPGFCLEAAAQGITCSSCAGTMQAAVKVDGKDISTTKNNGINLNELNVETIVLSLIVLVMIIILLTMLIRNFIIKKCGWTNWQYKDISESTDINNLATKTTIDIDDQVDKSEKEKKFQNVALI